MSKTSELTDVCTMVFTVCWLANGVIKIAEYFNPEKLAEAARVAAFESALAVSAAEHRAWLRSLIGLRSVCAADLAPKDGAP